MDAPSSFGLWLRQRRKQLDLTQEMLAERVGCSLSAIRKIESDERRPSREVAELLADCLQIVAKDRATFLKVARSELRIERLVALASPAAQPVTAPAPAPVQAERPSRSVLPIPLTPLVGRAAEVMELSRLLGQPDCRLLTLVGPGGMGKTRLAQALAADQQAAFAHGVAFVALAALSSPEFIMPALVHTLDLASADSTTPKTQLLNYLREKQMLLVLDNLEHLLDGIDWLTELLAYAPALKVLATSRERLNLLGEWVFDLHGLPTPPMVSPRPALPNQAVQAEVAVMQYGSVELFVKSTRRVLPSFALSAQNRGVVAHICRLVDGMPLGIELAAAWTPVISCQEIAQEIERNLDFLTVNRRDLPERHRSLRAVFDHSWQALTDEERRVLAGLALFRDGFHREAALAVADAHLPLLMTLSAKSLLYRTAEGRYAMHELIRQYALEKLQASGQGIGAAERHLHYFLQFVLAAREQLRGPNLVEWYNRLEQEHANVRAALTWAFTVDATSERIEQGLQLATANHRYWQGRGHLREGFTWLERGLQMNAAIGAATRANALQIGGWLLHQLGNSQRASTMLQESVMLYQELQDETNLAATLDFLGDVAWMAGDFPIAQQSYAASLAIFRKQGDPYHIGLSLYSAGRLHVDYGYYGEAESLLQEGLALLERIPHPRGIALCLNALGRLALFQAVNDGAGRQLRKALQIFYELGNKVDVAECLEALAILAAPYNKTQAVQLWFAAIDLREQLGVRLSAHDPLYGQAHHLGLMAQLTPTTESEKQALSLQQAVAAALDAA